MAVRGQSWRLIAALLATSAGACGASSATLDPGYQASVQPRVEEPSDDVERSVLRRLDALTADAETQVGGQSVVASAPYAAASGRVCRKIAIRGTTASAATPSRLVCHLDQGWVFVPDVLLPPGHTGGAP